MTLTHTYKKLTPNLVVADVARSVAFYVDVLGFSRGMMVPEYAPFVKLQQKASLILTDSGGVQEEAPSLGKPVLVLRETTERPITISHGTNVLLGDDPERLRDVRLLGRAPTPSAIPLWDGHAAERAADAVLTSFPEIVQTSVAALA